MIVSKAFGEIQLELPSQGLPKVSINNEGLLEIELPNSNKFTILYKSQLDPNILNMDAEIVNNSCEEQFVPVKCKFKTNTFVDRFALGWLSHEEKGLINKPFNNDMDSGTFSETNIWFWENKFGAGDDFVTVRVPNKSKPEIIINPELQCENISWIKPFLINSELKILEWTSEINTQNLETRVSENRASSAFFDVIGELKSDTITFKSLSHGVSMDVSSLLLGDILGWTIKSGNKLCELSIKADFNLIFNNLINQLGNLESPDGFTPLKLSSSNIEDIDQSFRINGNQSIIEENKDEIILKFGPKMYAELYILDVLGVIQMGTSLSTGVTKLSIELSQEVQQ